MTLSGEADMTPWSGYWWPVKSCKQVFGFAGKPAPLEKYDAHVYGSSPAQATNWEKLNIWDPTAHSWNGLCHAWANAAVLEEEPVHTSVVGNVYFSIGDKKCLLTLAHADDEQLLQSCDTNPLVFHEYLLEYIGENGLAFVADLDATEEVWSYPIYAYSMQITEGVSSDVVSCTIWYADDSGIGAGYVGTKERSKQYTYELKKNGSGDYTGGSWENAIPGDRPQYVWYPVAQQSLNPYLDYATIINIARSQEDGWQESFASGAYTVLVDPGEERSASIELPAGGSLRSILALDSQNPNQTWADYSLTIPGEPTLEHPLLEASSTHQAAPQAGDRTCVLEITGDNASQGKAVVRFWIDQTLPESVSIIDPAAAGSWFGLALVNALQGGDNTVACTLYDGAGLPMRSPLPMQKLGETAKHSFLVDVSAAKSVKLTSDRSLNVLNLVGDDALTLGPPLLQSNGQLNATTVVVPELTNMFSATKALFSLANVADTAANMTLEYYSPSGSFWTDAMVTLEPNEILNSASEGTYPGKVSLDGWALLHTDSPGALRGKVVVEKDLTGNELPLLVPGTSFYLPHVAADAVWATTLNLYNVNDQPVTVSLDLWAEGLTDTTQVTLAAHEKADLILDSQLFNLPDTEINKGWVSVSAPQPVAGYFNYTGGTAAAAFPLFEPEHVNTQKTLCHVAMDSYWWTGLVLLNSKSAAADVQFTWYDVSGTALGSTSRTIKGGAKLSSLARWLIPPKDQTKAASIRLQSTQPLLGLGLFGNNDGVTILSGIVLE